MRKLKLLLTCLFAVASISLVSAQTKTATGTVIASEDGLPVIGASVVVKGSPTVGTLTDANGRYSLNVPATSNVLVVTLVGMQTVEVSAGRDQTAYMHPDISELDEVMVVAYGTTTRSQFVGSAKSVSSEKLTAKATSNITNALQGQIAGVQVVAGSGQPGTGASIRIRGVGSINAGIKPLYVVDGAPYDETKVNLISPHDIQSMTVLKDAAATAIYGARGANGVILITTKAGKSDNKAVVNVETKWGNNSRAVPNYNVMTDPAMYYETAYKALYNSQIYNGKTTQEAYAFADNNFLQQNGVGYQIYTVPAGERIIGTNFKLNPKATLGYTDGDFYYTPDNWERESLRSNNLRQEYNVNIQGGGNESQYFISAGYLDDPGLVNGSGFSRYTLRGKIDSQVKKWLKVGLSLAYANADNKSPGNQTTWGSTGNVFNTANNMAPIYPFYVRNADGSYKYDERGIQVYDAGTTTNFIRPGSAPRGNHAINLLLNDNYNISDNINGTASMVITPMPGLSLTAIVSPNATNSRSRSLSNPFYGSVTTQGAVGIGHDRLFTLNQQYLARYKTDITELHTIEVLAGYESYKLTNQYLYGRNDILFNPYTGELNNAYGDEPTSSNLESKTDNFATVGYLGRVQYDFNNRYFANATVRHEASSRFSPENRWGTFASIGAAWIISREDFMLNTNSWLDELKFKISYGTQGNDQIGTYYAYRDLYSITYNPDTKEFNKTLGTKGNPYLTWEAQKLFNTGFDFSLLRSKLSGSLEYFSRVNSNMLFNVPMPPSAGYSSEPQNVGTVVNNGVELDLSGVILQQKDVLWLANANITTINSKIKKLPEYTAETGGIKSSSYILKEGGSLNQAYMVKYAGVDPETGAALYYVNPDEGDNSTTSDYSSAKQADLGSIAVKLYGGFGTTVQAYGFDFGIQAAYQLGGKAYDGGYQELMHTGRQLGRNWHLDILKAWTPENKDSNIPRISNADDHDQKPSDRWLVSTNFLSLNNLTFGYTLPADITKKAQIERLRVYVSGDNLGMLSARRGYDPRQTQNASATGVAISTSSGNFVYSQMKVISGGLSITF